MELKDIKEGERTPMAEDVREILRQNSKVLELNERILGLIVNSRIPKMTIDLPDHELENIHDKL